MRNWIDLCEGRRDSDEFVEMANELLREHPNVRASLKAEDHFDVAIQRLYVPEYARRQGYAAHFMQDLVKIADEIGIDLYLEAHPDEDEDNPIEIEALMQFYRSFGFEGEETEPGYAEMYRSAQ